MHPLRVALTGFIDYAGLFPPASLDLNRTAANHRRYAASPEAWLLGRLIIPAERLDQLSAVLPARRRRRRQPKLDDQRTRPDSQPGRGSRRHRSVQRPPRAVRSRRQRRSRWGIRDRCDAGVTECQSRPGTIHRSADRRRHRDAARYREPRGMLCEGPHWRDDARPLSILARARPRHRRLSGTPGTVQSDGRITPSRAE